MNHLGTITINTHRLKLRKFQLSDADEIFKGYRNQPEFLYYANKKPLTKSEQIDEINKIIEHYQDNNYYNWLITLNKTNEVIGSINLHTNLKNDSVMVNYAIDNRHTKNGYMTEALNAVVGFALEEIEANRIEGGCATENFASKRVLEKCNFILEGTLKSYIKLDDGYHDMFMFSIIKNK